MGIELKETNTRMLSICNDDKAMRYMIPRNDVPYGFNEFVPQNGNPSISIEVNIEEDEIVQKIRDMEDEIIRKVSEKSQSVFKCHKTPDEIKEMFNSNLKDGRLRLKHTRKTRLFDSDGKSMPTEVSGGDYRNWSAAISATVTSVYFFNKKVGLVWNADHIKLWEPEPELKGFAFTLTS